MEADDELLAPETGNTVVPVMVTPAAFVVV